MKRPKNTKNIKIQINYAIVGQIKETDNLEDIWKLHENLCHSKIIAVFFKLKYKNNSKLWKWVPYLLTTIIGFIVGFLTRNLFQ